MNKKTLIAIAVLIALGVGYYLVSPLWRNKTLNEASPLSQTATVKDNLDSINSNPALKQQFDKAMTESKDTVMEKTDLMPGAPKILAQADFKPRAHDVLGKALLIEASGKKYLRFENFETINGPDVRIYLATDLSDRDFVDLGHIKATKGNVNYEVPAGTDTAKYNKVLVWCKAFSVLFSYAELR